MARKSTKKKAGTAARRRKPSQATPAAAPRWVVERVQTGVRMEKRLVKVLKALAEYLDMTMGDLLEGVVLHAFEGKVAFSKETQKTIDELKRIYGLDLPAAAGHRLVERDDRSGAKAT